MARVIAANASMSRLSFDAFNAEGGRIESPPPSVRQDIVPCSAPVGDSGLAAFEVAIDGAGVTPLLCGSDSVNPVGPRSSSALNAATVDEAPCRRFRGDSRV